MRKFNFLEKIIDQCSPAKVWINLNFQQVMLNLFTAYTLDCGIFLKQTPNLQVASLQSSVHLTEVYQTTKRRNIQ